MKRFQSILWQELKVEAGGFRVLKLELHRHSPRLGHLGAHSHGHHQCLLYLSGSGRQRLAEISRSVHSGTLILVPAGIRHAYAREGGLPALCLVLAFTSPGLKVKKPVVVQMAAQNLSEVKKSLAAMARPGGGDARARRLWQAATALQLLHNLLTAAGLLTVGKPIRASGLVRRVESWMADPAHDALKLEALCDSLDVQRDSLNRRIKSETGLTLTQMRAAARVRRAKDALRRHPRVATAAAETGFADQNYFARWFRQQTGQTPVEWRRLQARGSA